MGIAIVTRPEPEKDVSTLPEPEQDVSVLPEEETPESPEEIRERIRAEVIKEMESEVERRVTNAYKAFQKDANAQMEEKRLQDQEKARQEQEKREQELQEKARKNALMEIRLEVIDLVSMYLREFSSQFREVIAYEDLLLVSDPRVRHRILKERVLDIRAEFMRQVKLEVKRQTEEFRKMRG